MSYTPLPFGAWKCSECGQANSPWATICGKCEVNFMSADYWGCCGKKKPEHRTECQYYEQLPAPESVAKLVAEESGIRDAVLGANAIQIGGEHYKKGGEEHWDRAWRLKYDPFQYIITKWVERWRDKGGVEDLKKAQHAIQKYIEVAKAEKS